MNTAESPGGYSPGTERLRVRDLLRRCGETRDRAEWAALLSRIADELDQAAQEISEHTTNNDTRELIAGLHGQAHMARFVADLEGLGSAYPTAEGPRAS